MVHDCFGEWEVASTTAEAASLLEVAGKPSSTKTNQPHLFFHDHLRVTSNSGIFLQTWRSVRELRSAAALKDRPRNAWASLRLSPGAHREALTGQREQAHIRPCPASNYCKDCKAFRTVSSAIFLALSSQKKKQGKTAWLLLLCLHLMRARRDSPRNFRKSLLLLCLSVLQTLKVWALSEVLPLPTPAKAGPKTFQLKCSNVAKAASPLRPNRPWMPVASSMSWAPFCTHDSFHGQYGRGEEIN